MFIRRKEKRLTSVRLNCLWHGGVDIVECERQQNVHFVQVNIEKLEIKVEKYSMSIQRALTGTDKMRKSFAARRLHSKHSFSVKLCFFLSICTFCCHGIFIHNDKIHLKIAEFCYPADRSDKDVRKCSCYAIVLDAHSNAMLPDLKWYKQQSGAVSFQKPTSTLC